MAWHPSAERNEIVPGSNDPYIIPVGVILHIAVAESRTLRHIFENRSGIESHFYVRRDGSFEQYRSTDREADANYKANSFYRDGKRCGYISIETQGMGDGEWTPEQVETILNITRWAAVRHDFPVTKATGPYSGGVGYHTLFPGIWTPVAKSCPGRDRIQQYHNVILPALQERENGGSTLSWNEDIGKWAPGDKDKDDTMPAGQQLNQARGFAQAAFQQSRQANRRVRRVEKAIAALATGLGDEVRAAVEAALASEVTADVDVHISRKDA